MAKVKAEKTNTITLSSGVVLEWRRVGWWIVNAAARRLSKPKVPMQFIEEKGREDPNPAHPDYIAALDEYDAAYRDIVYDAYLWFGTSILSKPENMLGPDEDWPADYAFLGIEAPEGKQRRYVEWVKMVACLGDEVEVASVITRVRAESTVSEEDVTAAAESFPGQ